MLPKYYINRELSWLKFNERVLDEARCNETPLFERLRFISIFSSNLDEFFMIRVGSLYDQSILKDALVDNKSGMTAKQQLEAIYRNVRELYPQRDIVYAEVMKRLETFDIKKLSFNRMNTFEKKVVKEYFQNQILPLLSPQVIDVLHPFPHLENKRLYIVVKLDSNGQTHFGIIPLSDAINQVFVFPENGINFVLPEDLLLKYVEDVFKGYTIQSKSIIRVTRNADIITNDLIYDEDMDYRNFLREILKKRTRLSPVRLEIFGKGDKEIEGLLKSKLNLSANQYFKTKSPINYQFFNQLIDRLSPSMKERLLYKHLTPQKPFIIMNGKTMMEQIDNSDIFLSYPYESMRPFIDLLKEASEANDVISMKITLYRLGAQSQVVQYLCAAAENGKEVTVVLELRARFDEQNNINWSTRLEEAGCRVIYGLEDYKIHSKIMLITRRRFGSIKYITHIATGNYNENTAKLYTDIGILTANQEIGEDAVQFFNNLTIANIKGSYKHLLVAPSYLKKGIMDLINDEIFKAKEGKPAKIVAKFNSLTDKGLIDALISASQAGVSILLIIRGVCCLQPGIEGFTDHIRVISIVGRFLEHSRIYSFGEGEDRKIYISSADLMTRNTERRVEIATPILSEYIAERISDMLNKMMKDNYKARELKSDGNYEYVKNDEPIFDSQLRFYEEAYLLAQQGQEIERVKKTVENDSRENGIISFFKGLFSGGEN